MAFVRNEPLLMVDWLGLACQDSLAENRCYFCAYAGGVVEHLGCYSQGCGSWPMSSPVPIPPRLSSYCQSRGGWPGFTSSPINTTCCDEEEPVPPTPAPIPPPPRSPRGPRPAPPPPPRDIPPSAPSPSPQPEDDDCCVRSDQSLISLIMIGGGRMPGIDKFVRLAGRAKTCAAAGKACHEWALYPHSYTACLDCCMKSLSRVPYFREDTYCGLFCQPLSPANGL